MTEVQNTGYEPALTIVGRGESGGEKIYRVSCSTQPYVDVSHHEGVFSVFREKSEQMPKLLDRPPLIFGLPETEKNKLRYFIDSMRYFMKDEQESAPRRDEH